VTSRYSLLFIFLSLIFLSGCLGVKHLKENETLLYKQQIKGNQKVHKNELSTFYRQNPNRTLPLLPLSPYVYMYHYGLKHFDQKALEEEKKRIENHYQKKLKANKENKRKRERIEKRKNKKLDKLKVRIEEGNVWMRWGEPIATYQEELAKETADQMRFYLQSKGYFTAETSFKTHVSRKKTTVTYMVKENTPYSIDSVFYNNNDEKIKSILNQSQDKTKFKKGDNYDQVKISGERERIESLLRNNGYFDFNRQYIEFNVDTTIGNHKVWIETVIHAPASRGFHKQFKVDSINFITDANVTGYQGQRNSTYYRGVTWQYHRYRYSKKVLSRKVFIKKDSLYNRQFTFETQRQLGNLDMFKFVNITYDTTGGKFVANILTSPLKKYQYSTEAGMNVSQQLPGPMVNFNIKNRNVFGGMEILEFNMRAGIEGVTSAMGQGVYRGQEAGGNLSLVLPQFAIPFADKLGPNIGHMNPRTRLLTGFNYVNRPEYIRRNIKTSITYSWQKNNNVFFSFIPTEVNIIESTIQLPRFQEWLDQLAASGNMLVNTFRPSFVSSSIFHTTFNFNKYGSGKGSSAFLRILAESGGTTLNFFDPTIITNEGLEFFQFLKFSTDFRKYQPLFLENVLAFRVHMGYALPYGENGILPYEKYFFLGGSNSNRAWRPRRLGPGSYTPAKTFSDGYPNYELEQPGEIFIETSLEIRRPLFGPFHGAFFIDAGNTWVHKEEETRPNAHFETNRFYKEIAVGSGLGLRLDFSFLIVRFDAGVKIHDPGREEGKRFIGQQFPLLQELKYTTFNLGIGYPF
jgi:outer membrane protein insertion porin family